LKEIKHKKANAISNKNLEIILLDMPWKTNKNKTDCGVFVMRHMETYKGEQIKTRLIVVSLL